MLLLELTGRRLVTGKELPDPLTPLEQSSSAASLDLDCGVSAASRSHMNTSPPRPPEATILLYCTLIKRENNQYLISQFSMLHTRASFIAV